jgi:hypothetical protein
LCECQFVTIVIDIVHDTAISVRRKGLIGSTEDFRFIIADFGLSYRFSMSAPELGYNEWNPSSLTPRTKDPVLSPANTSNCHWTTTAC